MPKAFDQCLKNGGRVRTISGPDEKHGLGQGEYLHVCFDRRGMHRGHKKRKGKIDEAVDKGTEG